jgi:hypothetical protein
MQGFASPCMPANSAKIVNRRDSHPALAVFPQIFFLTSRAVSVGPGWVQVFDSPERLFHACS